MFRSVNQIKTHEDKKILRNLVSLYIAIVDCFVKINKIHNFEVNQEIPFHELKALGIIETESDIKKLELLLSNAYQRFIQSVKIKACLLKENEFLARFNSRISSHKSKRPNLVDLFCGAGGLSLGFCQEGFDIALANDINGISIETYKFNHYELPLERIIQGDICKLCENIEDYISEEIDILIGGPPCQGFSHANQQKTDNDPRNKLYKYFIKAIEKIGPKFVVMENVRGITKYAEGIIKDFNGVKYSKNNKIYTYEVAYKVLNSKDFGVAQSRERLFFIAIRNDVQQNKNIIPEKLFENLVKSHKLNRIFNLSDALDFLRPLEASEIRNDRDNYKSGNQAELNHFKQQNEYLELINNNQKNLIVFNHKARYCNLINKEIYQRLKQGDDATCPSIADIMPYSHRNHLFKDKYFKLIAEKPSRTITAHLKMDGHSHIHPTQARSITPREAARIQSFPDNYVFLGSSLDAFMQIGNAVPPLIARAIAKEIKRYLL